VAFALVLLTFIPVAFLPRRRPQPSELDDAGAPAPLVALH
jgi:hypothetical protein